MNPRETENTSAVVRRREMVREENIYMLLGLNEGADPVTVKRAFRHFARKHHPDLFPGDNIKEERFKRVSSAYNRWRIVQVTLEEMKRLRERSVKVKSSGFIPWDFSHAC